jgi:hypothetical protein
MVRHGLPETFKKEARFPDALVKPTGNFTHHRHCGVL